MEISIWTGRHATALRRAYRAAFPELSDERFADKIQVSARTLYDWQRRPDTVLRPATQALLKDALTHAGEVVRGQFHQLITAEGQATRTDLSRTASPSPALSGLRVAVPSDREDIAAMQAFRAADLQVGGGHLYANVVQYLGTQLAPRLFGMVSSSSTARLLAASSGLTEMAGWMAHDAGRNNLARQHFTRALDLASTAGDRQLEGHVLGSLSHLADYNGSPAEAVGYSQRGQEVLRAAPNPTLEARLLAFEARASAAMGNSTDTAKLLFNAEERLTQAPKVEPSPWTGPFDEGSLASEAARSLRQLGQFDSARENAERIIELRHGRARSHAFGLLTMAQILLMQPRPRPEEACTIATTALDATKSLSSYLVVKQLKQLSPLISPYQSSPSVIEFQERLRIELEDRVGFHSWLAGNTDQGSSPEAL